MITQAGECSSFGKPGGNYTVCRIDGLAGSDFTRAALEITWVYPLLTGGVSKGSEGEVSRIERKSEHATKRAGEEKAKKGSLSVALRRKRVRKKKTSEREVMNSKSAPL